MAERRLRIVVVGTGRRGQAYLATLRGLTDLFDLVAVCDLDLPLAQQAAARAGCAVFQDVRVCLEKSAPDAVVIVTPGETHHLVAQIAARCGLPMLIETPLAPTRAMMDVIGGAAAAAGVPVEVAENYGRRPCEQLNVAAIRAGLIGQVVHLSVLNAPANEDCCYHTMSLLRAYAGADVSEIRVLAHDVAWARGPGRDDRETWVDAQLAFQNGVVASVTYTNRWTAPIRMGRPRIHLVEGTAGFIVTTESAPDRLWSSAGGDAASFTMQVETRPVRGGEAPLRYYYATRPEIAFLNPFADRVLTDGGPAGMADGIARALELRALHRAVCHGTAPEFSIAEARRSQELGIAIAEAALTGCGVPARLGPETRWERAYHVAVRERWGIDPLEDVDRVLERLLQRGKGS